MVDQAQHQVGGGPGRVPALPEATEVPLPTHQFDGHILDQHPVRALVPVTDTNVSVLRHWAWQQRALWILGPQGIFIGWRWKRKRPQNHLRSLSTYFYSLADLLCPPPPLQLCQERGMVAGRS